MIAYKVLHETIIIEGRKTVTYGIAAADENSSFIAVVHDVTPSLKKATALCELCQRLCLSPVHLRDMVEDYIISDDY